MADEIVAHRYRHVISMAIFKEKNFYEKERERIWKKIEDKYNIENTRFIKNDYE